ncbi:hypothetical protein B0H17DRAFT_1145895 [Mycena rosella]|uniref:Uncharacterized protein n=1 Tax=Mycena rosella TaxID=1033263 RepID=A0AAD7CQ09_MYCRO|nr:hypothetical protein B0H17DRAFT_1145895 [Mycena rosella]
MACISMKTKYIVLTKRFISDFETNIPANQLSLGRTKQSTAARWNNLTSLYCQIMVHFETTYASSVVQIGVPNLAKIANRDEDIMAKAAIVQMNALVLGVYVQFHDGLAQFRRLSEDDEEQLEADMLAIGAGKLASVNRGKDVLPIDDQYYYLRWHYYEHITGLQDDINKLKTGLEESQEELGRIQAESYAHESQLQSTETKWQYRWDQVTEETAQSKSTIEQLEDRLEKLVQTYQTTAFMLKKANENLTESKKDCQHLETQYRALEDLFNDKHHEMEKKGKNHLKILESNQIQEEQLKIKIQVISY